MSEMTTFPRSTDVTGTSMQTGIYARVRSAASSMLYSMISEPKNIGKSVPGHSNPDYTRPSGRVSSRITRFRSESPPNSPIEPLQPQPPLRLSKEKPIPRSAVPTKQKVVVNEQLALLKGAPRPTKPTVSISKLDVTETALPSISRRRGSPVSDSESVFSYTGASDAARNFLAQRYTRDLQPSVRSLDKEFWMKDENARTCFRCSKKFTTFRRKHHCRVCGQIFCGSCSELVNGDLFRQNAKVRCCLYCIPSVLGRDPNRRQIPDHDQSTNGNAGLAEDNVESDRRSAAYESFVQERRSRRGSRLADFEGLIKMQTPERQAGGGANNNNDLSLLPAVTFSPTISTLGSNYLTDSDLSDTYDLRTRTSSLALTPSADRGRNNNGNDSLARSPEPFGLDDETMERGRHLYNPYLSSLPYHRLMELNFNSHRRSRSTVSLRKFSSDELGSQLPRSPSLGSTDFILPNPGSAPQRRYSSSGMRRSRSNSTNQPQTQRPLLLSQQTEHQLQPQHGHQPQQTPEKPQWDSWPLKIPFSSSYILSRQGSRGSCKSLELSPCARNWTSAFLDQLLADSGLPKQVWHGPLEAQLISLATMPNLDEVLKDHGELRKFVKLKCLPGGRPSDIERIAGIVFTHAVALKSMHTEVQNPRVLLISFPIEYTRGEHTYMSLQAVHAQEEEYLRKLVGRILSLSPTMVLSSTVICRSALQMLNDAGVVVATSISDLALTRLSYYLRTDILGSLDRLAVVPYLGKCGKFTVRTYRVGNVAKSFMFFTGGSEGFGCTILIRGSDESVPSAKLVLHIMMDVVFSLKMETALMKDQLVSRPCDKDESPVLSSSPFVEYALPHLLLLANKYEERVVEANRVLDQLKACIKGLNSPSPTAIKAIEPSGGHADTTDSDLAAVKHQPLQPETELRALINNLGFKLGDHPEGLKESARIAQAVLQIRADTAGAEWSIVKEQWDLFQKGNESMWNPVSHQSLPFTFVLHNTDSGACLGPDTLLIDFYLENDLSLGRYIESTIQAFSLPCPDGCPKMLGNHRRCYYHGNALLTFTAEREPCPVEGLQNSILMWSCCKVCERISPKTTLSSASWKFSFGKYLELSFWGKPLFLSDSECHHDIYKDHIRCFSWQDTILRVEYQPIPLYRLELPKLILAWDPEKQVGDKTKRYEKLQSLLTNFWTSLIISLEGAALDEVSEEKRDDATQTIEKLMATANQDRELTMLELDRLYLDLHPTDTLGLDKILIRVQDLVAEWQSALDQFDTLFFPSESYLMQATSQQFKGLFLDDEKPKDASAAVSLLDSLIPESNEVQEPKPEQRSRPTRSTSLNSESSSNLGPTRSEPMMQQRTFTRAKPVAASGSQSGDESDSQISLSKRNRDHNDKSSTLNSTHSTSDEGRKVSPARGRVVSSLARHFEQITEEFERERERERLRVHARQHALAARYSSRPIVDVFQEVDDALKDGGGWDQEAGADEAAMLNLEKPCSNTQPASLVSDSGVEQSGKRPSISRRSSALEITRRKENTVEKKSLLKSLVKFWAERPSNRWTGIKYVLGPGEHILSDSPVVIRDSEPSSLIAFCLQLPDYEKRVQSVYNNQSPEDIERVFQKQTGVHMRYQFADGSARYLCKVFFSEQFDALRRQCNCHHDYIQSLSRCSKWDNNGGKSGSSFLKTNDERLIIKELSQAEFDSMASFIPSYFEYMAQAIFHDMPTALAKIFGIYQIQVFNPSTGNNIKLYVQVSENLVYDREFTKIFDLKGSMRNRKVEETGVLDQVLLDENMVEYIHEQPLFMRDHLKDLLRASLYNDTLFLTKMNVMDYSLVLAINEKDKSISAGIIDFVRTFTWDKKIESWVKAKASTGVKEPTVISPRQYKVRFRESMERYLLSVPDCWTPTAVLQKS